MEPNTLLSRCQYRLAEMKSYRAKQNGGSLYCGRVWTFEQADGTVEAVSIDVLGDDRSEIGLITAHIDGTVDFRPHGE